MFDKKAKVVFTINSYNNVNFAYITNLQLLAYFIELYINVLSLCGY